MIYLTRTTIDLDGTHTTEIAALEDGAWLGRYEAQGFVAGSYEVYRAAWRAKALAQRDGRQFVEQAPETLCCPECSHGKITIFADGTRHCRRCKNNW